MNKARAIRDYTQPKIPEKSGDDDHPIAEWSDGTQWLIVNITIGEMKQWPKPSRPRLTQSKEESQSTVNIGRKKKQNDKKKKAAEKAAAKEAEKAEKAAGKAAAKHMKRPAGKNDGAKPKKPKHQGPPLPEEFKDKVPLVMPEIGYPS